MGTSASKVGKKKEGWAYIADAEKAGVVWNTSTRQWEVRPTAADLDGGGRPVRRAPLALQLPEGYMIKGGKFLPMGTLTELPNAVRPLVAGDGIPRRILAFLPPLDVGVDSLRVVSRGGWMLIERNLRTALVRQRRLPPLPPRWASIAKTTWMRCWEDVPLVDVPALLPTGASATGAEMLALCRGLQQKAVMIDLVNELQVTGVDVDVPLTEWKGVTMGADGQVVKIDFSRRCKGGA